MEPQTDITPTAQQESHEHNPDLCVQCQAKPFEAGYPINLCTDCRASLIKYPIPNWLKYFAAGILLVMVLSIFRTQKYISAAIHLGRAEKAIELKNYVTAENELKKVLADAPDGLIANANMVIASIYNLDMAETGPAYTKIENKDFDDETELLKNVESALAFLDQNMVNDTVVNTKVAATPNTKPALLKLVKENNSLSIQLKIVVANALYDLKEYKAADSLALEAISINSESQIAIRLLSATKRELKEFDKALAYCNDMLKINHQDIYAISQKARIELKRKNDERARKYVDEAMAIDPDSDLALEAKALTDYLTGHKKDADATFNKIKNLATISGDNTIRDRISPILNGSLQYR
ncbi:hypothetical protein IM792_10770 [Mucilaginibacter sp. JRF]|uniref:tetratricopeptide repeat protein n=1 Tax=Mucilaginibacter sp. JRF TaxID=2780088 RepID=UPI001882A2A2|nr:hypothetical protein [Mucilaginibacter sp. JRF]MBE9584931.1 hypothetical protein [Mucilaginibacter sp. JRF]